MKKQRMLGGRNHYELLGQDHSWHLPSQSESSQKRVPEHSSHYPEEFGRGQKKGSRTIFSHVAYLYLQGLLVGIWTRDRQLQG